MNIDADANPYSAPLAPIPVDRSGFPWNRWRIVPMAVCWLSGGLMILVSTFATGYCVLCIFQPGQGIPISAFGCCLTLGVSGFVLMYSALLWMRGQWLPACGLTCMSGLILMLLISVILAGS
jgi:hypothetical protein